MIIEQAVLKTLADDATIAGYVAARIYFMRAPQNTAAPYITLFKVSAPRDATLDGASGLVRGRIQVDVYAETYMGSKDIAAAVKAALVDYSGDMANSGFPYVLPSDFGVPVNGVDCDDESDYWEEENKLYHVQMDFLIWYNE